MTDREHWPHLGVGEQLRALRLAVSSIRDGSDDEARKDVAGGWSLSERRGGTYSRRTISGLREIEGVQRVEVIYGDQVSSRARLLDAAAGFRASCMDPGVLVVAVLRAPAINAARPDQQSSFFESARFRQAAWERLGVLWGVGIEESDYSADAIEFSQGRVGIGFAQFRSTVSALRETLDTEVYGLLTVMEAKRSREVERAVHQVLAGCPQRQSGEWRVLREAKFASAWREAVTDGAMLVGGEMYAIEVKSQEDGDAPFGQILDDLAIFDGVIQIRVVEESSTTSHAHEDAREYLSKDWPVAFISLSREKFRRSENAKDNGTQVLRPLQSLRARPYEKGRVVVQSAAWSNLALSAREALFAGDGRIPHLDLEQCRWLYQCFHRAQLGADNGLPVEPISAWRTDESLAAQYGLVGWIFRITALAWGEHAGDLTEQDVELINQCFARACSLAQQETVEWSWQYH